MLDTWQYRLCFKTCPAAPRWPRGPNYVRQWLTTDASSLGPSESKLAHQPFRQCFVEPFGLVKQFHLRGCLQVGIYTEYTETRAGSLAARYSVILSFCLSLSAWLSVWLTFWHPVDILNNFCFDNYAEKSLSFFLSLSICLSFCVSGAFYRTEQALGLYPDSDWCVTGSGFTGSWCR